MDKLCDVSDLLQWEEAAHLLPSDWLVRLDQPVNSRPEEAVLAYERATPLGQAICRIFTDVAGETSTRPGVLVVLNEILKDAQCYLLITQSSQGFVWQWVEVPGYLDQILWPVSHTGADLTDF